MTWKLSLLVQDAEPGLRGGLAELPRGFLRGRSPPLWENPNSDLIRDPNGWSASERESSGDRNRDLGVRSVQQLT